MHAFTLNMQRLAAGRQYLHAWSARKHVDGSLGGCADEVLTIVEHQQHALVFERADQCGERLLGVNFEPKRCSKRARDDGRVTQRRQVNEPNAVLIGLDHPLGHGLEVTTRHMDARPQWMWVPARALSRSGARNGYEARPCSSLSP